MRIVHTSDWHAGRTWKGVDRHDELEAVLDDLLAYIEREDVDLVLHTGDVFDSRVPPARAEKLVFGFLRRLGALDVRSVVIAGNHDQPERVEAWGQLAALVGVTTRGLPQPAAAGGAVRIATRSGDAVVAMVPFAAPARLVSAAELASDDTGAVQKYADAFGRVVANVCGAFDPAAVNLLCAHTHLDGAVLSGSERRVHLGDDWAPTPQILPTNAHYVALGHIHRPQEVLPNVLYAGSPLQLDFGEEGDEKSFVVIDAEAGLPARIRRVPYSGGRRLRTVRATLPELEARVDELGADWLRVVVPVDAPDPDLNRKVRRLLPRAVSVDVELPRTEAPTTPDVTLAVAAAVDVYQAWHRRTHGRDADPEVLDAFEALRTAQEGE